VNHLKKILAVTAVLVAALGMSASSCELPIGGVVGGCRTAVDCSPFQECNAGACRCVDNRGCGDGEFCNAVFKCQTIAGCQDNTDCEEQGADLVCNTKIGQCDPRSICFDDSNCPLNKICSASGSCVDACMDEADCVPGAGCVREVGNEALGVCAVGSCSDTTQCRAGYNCDLPTHTCVFDTRGPFCGACQAFDPEDPQCGDGQYANYCLIDTSDPTGDGHFCGVDCSQEQACPSGYECSQVIIVGPPATPQCGVETCVNQRCTQTGGGCTLPEDCPLGPPGGDCPRGHTGICAGSSTQVCNSDEECGGSVGSCRKAQCSGGENAAIGFCSCVIDGDCPADTCEDADLTDPDNPVYGHCYLSGKLCVDSITDCSVIACVNGGCLIGSNCAPSGERRCGDLLQP